MIELEIQTLSERREGLLIEVGRSVVASGFVTQRQRLAENNHGVLLTMVVRGPARKQRALSAALDAMERIISFQLSPFDEATPKPHFAATFDIVRPSVAPLPTPPADKAAPAAPAPAAPAAEADTPSHAAAPVAPIEPEVEQELIPDFMVASPPASPPEPPPQTPLEPTPVAPAPLAELIPTGPDEQAVANMLIKVTNDYPQIFPRLLMLDGAVAAGARESSLQLIGQRTGAWIFKRDYAVDARLDLDEAIARVGMPALAELVGVERRGDQLHIRNSPLCTEDGHSGCQFFTGYLEGLLGPAMASSNLSIFSICCRSYGADECALAISD